MALEYDPGKDAANVAKHGVSLARAADLEDLVVVADGRFAEPRFRGYGTIDGAPFCLAFTLRGDVIRAISLRRAHAKEMKRHT